jgi:hypothetical protein
MKQTNPDNKLPKKGAKALKDRVNKHLKDKNDIITDEDMKNINVGEDVDDSKAADDLTKALEAKKQTSPWSILSEEDK